MGVITTSHFAELLWPGIKAIYGAEYAEYPEEYKQIFKVEPSDRAYEEILGWSGFGLAPVIDEGSGVTFATMKQGFKQRATHVKYGIGFIITKEAYDDNQYDMPMKQGSRGLAFSMRQTKEYVHANIFNRAFNSTYSFSDGQELCSADHPNVSGGTWSNYVASDLDEDSLETACNSISQWTNDAGLIIALKPKALIIPPQLQFEAVRILQSITQNDTANGAINALRTMGSIPQIIVNHYLTDTDAWFIQTNATNGLISFERQKDTFARENDWDTDNAKFKAVGRYSCTCADPRALYGSAGA